MRMNTPWLVAVAIACSIASGCSNEISVRQDGGPPPGGADGGLTDDFHPRTITLLETSDLHANLMPWNYFSAVADSKVGLAKVATLVAQERLANPCSLLIDNGDTLQGTPLGTYFATVDNTSKHPMAVAMNSLRYDAMTVGNHEFNFGMVVLERFATDASFPLLGANVKKADGSPAFSPYIIKEICGVKVGILGLVTPSVTTWERPENIPGLTFDLPIPVAQAALPKMRADGAEVIVVAFHAGPDKQPVTGNWLSDPSTWESNGSMSHENDALELAQTVPGIDVILTGHTHLDISKMLIGNTLLIQPKRWGSHLGEVNLGVDHSSGSWVVASHDSKLLAVDGVAPDAALTALIRASHETAMQYVDTKIGTAFGAFPGGDEARFTDSALADLINAAQTEAAQATGHPVDVSLAAVFNNTGMIPKGEVKLRDAYSAYVYDNTLYVMEITGKILRDALEQDAAYFATLDAASLPATAAECKAPAARDYNWDIYSGIDYTIDVTRPVGSRVTKLKLRGVNVMEAQTLRIAVNNYRGGGGGYAAFKDGKLLWESADGVRDYLVAYITAHPSLNPDTLNTCNFTLVPNLYDQYFTTPQKCAMESITIQP